jgi:hypothetical protein
VPIPPHLRNNLASNSIHSFPAETAQSMFDFRADDVVGKIAPRPLLLLHAANDSVTPTEQSIELFKRAGQPTELHLISDADVSCSARATPASGICCAAGSGTTSPRWRQQKRLPPARAIDAPSATASRPHDAVIAPGRQCSGSTLVSLAAQRSPIGTSNPPN